MMIDSCHEDLDVYHHLLKQDKENKYQFLEADTGEEALEILWTTPVNCILLSDVLPDMTGMALLTSMTSNAALSRVPVIFLASQGNDLMAVNAMKNGATDYLIKPNLTRELLVRAIFYSIDKMASERDLEENFFFLNTLLDTIPNPIFYKDVHGKYLGCNPSFESMVGVSKQLLTGKTADEIVPALSTKAIKEIDRRLIEKPGVITLEATLRDASGTFREIILSQASYMDSRGDVKGFLGCMTDITDRKTMENQLKETALALDLNVKELQKANRQILAQQKAVIEEERLKVLLQMAGATAHEINQPLSVLLWHMELMNMHKDDPEKILKYAQRVETSGQRIAEIVKKIQTIRHYEVMPYPGNSTIININQSLGVLCVEPHDDDFERIAGILSEIGNICPKRARTLEAAHHILETTTTDLILVDLFDDPKKGFTFLEAMTRSGIEAPVVVVTNQQDEMIASRIIQAGAYDYLTKRHLSRKSLFRVLSNALEKYKLKKDIRQTTEKLSEMSTRDELTGLYNRKYFMEILERKAACAERYRNNLALCLMEMTNLETVNGSLGVHAGDKLVVETAKVLQRISRKNDIPCRIGGKLFAVIITDTSTRNAKTVSERFRKKIEEQRIAYQGTFISTILTIGLSIYTHSKDMSFTDLIRKAEHAIGKGKIERSQTLRVV